MRRVHVLFALVPACAEYPPIEYVGRRVEVGTYFSEELCRGEILRLDSLVDRSEDDFDVTIPGIVGVYLYDRSEGVPAMPVGMCRRRDAWACADTVRRRVIATMEDADHEIVHIGAAQLGRPWSFYLTEGAANAFSEDRVFFSGTTPSSNLRLKDPDFIGSGHFMRWLWETYGAQPTRGVLRRRGLDPEEVLEEEIGVGLAQMEERYLAEAPGSYPRRSPCSEPLLPALAGPVAAWEETVTIDCAADTTMGRADMPYVKRTLQIDAAGYYVVEPSAGVRASFMRCQMSPADLAFVDAPAELRDPSRVRHEEWTHPSGSFTPSKIGRPTRLWFDAGLHEVQIVEVSASATSPARVRVTTALAVP